VRGRGKPAKKYSQAARVHDIIRLVEARHGMTIDELAEEAQVTRRTIHRDLIAIHEAGYPLVSDWENGRKVYRFMTRFKDMPPISFTLQEIASLHILRGQAELFSGTPFVDELDTIFGKIRSVLPPRYSAHLERIASVQLPLLQGRHDYGNASGLLYRLREALIHQHRLTLSYRPAGRRQPTSYQVDPYTLIFHKGGMYLLGYAHNRQALRTFAVERICDLEVEKERFELPPDYRPEDRLKDAFGIVAEPVMQLRVRFSAEVAQSVKERIWHPSQRIRRVRGGRVELALKVGGRLEIIAWLLSYGEHAEVLEPADLREEMASRASRMNMLYEGGSIR
jgi:proteasome accessory factor B